MLAETGVRDRPRAAMAIVVATVLVDMIGAGIVMPVLPHFIMELTGDTIASAARDAGWLGFAFALVQFLAAPIMGSLSDRFGRRPVLVAALMAFSANYFLTAMAPSILWLFAGRIVAGATGASFVTAYAYVTDISLPEQRTQNFGLLGMAMGVGFVIGPALGGFASEFGPRAPFLLAGAIAAANAIAAWIFLRESLPVARRRPFSLKRSNPITSVMRLGRDPMLVRIAIAIFIVQLTFMMLNTSWPFYTIARFGWTGTMIGLSLTFSGLLSAIVRGGLIRKVVPRWGEQRVVAGAIVSQIVGHLIMSFGWRSWMMFAGIAVHTVAGLAYPALSGMASHRVPHDEQGELQGAIASLTGLSA
ncbi:MAG: tetracycline resistance efflux pump, partial [Rhizorhabdus sp.]|nr:tetracycline resistance efflux pump [Rhizorhabdus sp.]